MQLPHAYAHLSPSHAGKPARALQNRALGLALEKERTRVAQLKAELVDGGGGGGRAGGAMAAMNELDSESVQVRIHASWVQNMCRCSYVPAEFRIFQRAMHAKRCQEYVQVRVEARDPCLRQQRLLCIGFRA